MENNYMFTVKLSLKHNFLAHIFRMYQVQPDLTFNLSSALLCWDQWTKQQNLIPENRI